MPRKPPFRFYQITDRKLVGEEGLPHILGELARGGLRGLQIREKDLSDEKLLRLVDGVLPHLTPDVHVLINDRVDVALERGLGLHRPESGLPTRMLRKLLGADVWLGVSCHDLIGCLRAEEEGADFVTLAPVFPTRGKGDPLGLDSFRQIVSQLAIPVFALGGVTPKRTPVCMEAGAYGVSAISATLGSDNPQRVLAEFREALPQEV